MKNALAILLISLLTISCQDNKQKSGQHLLIKTYTISTTVILPDTLLLMKGERDSPFFHLEHFQDLFTNLSLLKKTVQKIGLKTNEEKIKNNLHFKVRKPTDFVEIEFHYSDTVTSIKFFTLHLKSVLDSIYEFNRADSKAKINYYNKKVIEIADSMKMPELQNHHLELNHRYTYFLHEYSIAQIEYAGISKHIKILVPPHVKK